MSRDKRRLRALQTSRQELLVDSGQAKLWTPNGAQPQQEREVPGSWVEPPVRLEPLVEDGLRQRHQRMAGHHGVNAYKCDDCQQLVVTLDLHVGTTPMFLGCRATPGCGGRMVSSGYPRGHDPLPERIREQLAWTWYRPGEHELRWLRANEPGMYDHVQRGGLALRPWRDGDTSAYQRPYDLASL